MVSRITAWSCRLRVVRCDKSLGYEHGLGKVCGRAKQARCPGHVHPTLAQKMGRGTNGRNGVARHRSKFDKLF